MDVLFLPLPHFILQLGSLGQLSFRTFIINKQTIAKSIPISNGACQDVILIVILESFLVEGDVCKFISEVIVKPVTMMGVPLPQRELPSLALYPRVGVELDCSIIEVMSSTHSFDYLFFYKVPALIACISGPTHVRICLFLAWCITDLISA
jgi:hypothetical protein